MLNITFREIPTAGLKCLRTDEYVEIRATAGLRLGPETWGFTIPGVDNAPTAGWGGHPSGTLRSV